MLLAYLQVVNYLILLKIVHNQCKIILKPTSIYSHRIFSDVDNVNMAQGVRSCMSGVHKSSYSYRAVDGILNTDPDKGCAQVERIDPNWFVLDLEYVVHVRLIQFLSLDDSDSQLPSLNIFLQFTLIINTVKSFFFLRFCSRSFKVGAYFLF